MHSGALDPYLLLIILLSLFFISPLLQPGYFWDAHDARHSVYFLFELDRGIQDGLVYPRWQPDFAFGYGYPFFNIYGPLSTFVAEAFHLLGFGFVDAVKIAFALAIVGSGLAMYGFARRVLGREAGLVAAVAYMAIPYRLVDVYVRAALAESMAYVFVPLVLWGMWAALHQPRLLNVLGLAFAYAALMVCHPLTALLLTLILAAAIAVLTLSRINDKQPLRRLSRESFLPLLGHVGHIVAPVAAGLILGLGISAFFALPAMTENRFVRLDQWYGGRYAWGGDFVEFFQLFSPAWGFGVSVPGPDDGLSYQLGAMPVVLSLFSLVLLFRRELRKRLSRPSVRMIAYFGGLTVVAIALMLSISAPLWQALPLAQLTQFPWRLLFVTVLSMAFLCGAVVSRPVNTAAAANSYKVGTATVILIALLILSSLPYVRAEMSEQEVSMAGLMRFQQSSDEMTGSTAWVREIPRWSSMADYHIAGLPVTSKINYSLLYAQGEGVHARTIELHVQSELIEYLSPKPIEITFDTFYYPGWRAYLLDAETNQVIEELEITQRGKLGLMTVQVPAGLGRVLLRFEDTPMRLISKVLTFGSLALVALLLVLRLRLLGRLAHRARQARGT